MNKILVVFILTRNLGSLDRIENLENFSRVFFKILNHLEELNGFKVCDKLLLNKLADLLNIELLKL